jgi:hypothetical protein
MRPPAARVPGTVDHPFLVYDMKDILWVLLLAHRYRQGSHQRSQLKYKDLVEREFFWISWVGVASRLFRLISTMGLSPLDHG